MKWEWIALLYIFRNICSLELGTSSLPAITNKKLNKGLHKVSKVANNPPDSVVDSGNLQKVHESYFPDVLYPTSVLESNQPFYYSQQAYDDVFGPFSNDIKSTFKTLASGKGKNKNTIFLNEPSNKNDNSSTTNNKDIINMELHNNSPFTEDASRNTNQSNTFQVINETTTANNYLYINDLQHINQNTSQDVSHDDVAQDVSNDATYINKDILYNQTQELPEECMEENLTITAITENQLTSIEPKKNVLERNTLNATNINNTYQEYVTSNCFVISGVNDIQEDSDSLYTRDITYDTSNQSNELHVTSDIYNSSDYRDRLNGVNSNNTNYVNITSNDALIHDTNSLQMEHNNKTYSFNVTPNNITTAITSNNQDDMETSETRNRGNTYYVNSSPDYVVTSHTSNTREDFVSDIMNIYSLIEETLRAVSVVEFVVSKTLGSLGLKENQNETIAYDYQFQSNKV